MVFKHKVSAHRRKADGKTNSTVHEYERGKGTKPAERLTGIRSRNSSGDLKQFHVNVRYADDDVDGDLVKSNNYLGALSLGVNQIATKQVRRVDIKVVKN
jgi:hypothetical protein